MIAVLGGQRGEQVGVGPVCVALLDAVLDADSFPERGRLADPLGAQLQTDERFEGAFRRSADGAFAAQHFAQLFDVVQMRHARACRDRVDPAFDEGEHGLQPAQGFSLFGAVRHANLGQVHGGGDGFGIHGSRAAQLLLHRVQIDVDAAGVLADQRFEARHEPRDRREEPRVRELLQGEEGEDLALVDAQRSGVCGRILRDDGAGRVLEQGDALIEAAPHAVREVARGVAKLHRERGVAQQFDEFGRILHPLGDRDGHGPGEDAGDFGAEFAAQALRKHRGQGVAHRLRDGCGETRPSAERRLDPAGPREDLRLTLRRREIADGVEPQIGFAHRGAHCIGLLGAEGLLRTLGVGLLQGDGGGQLHVDRPLLDGVLHIVDGVETARRERLHERTDVIGLGQRAGGLVHELVAHLRRQLRELVPGDLPLHLTEAVNQPLVNRIVIHTRGLPLGVVASPESMHLHTILLHSRGFAENDMCTSRK